jgi:hypothetical protein
MMKTKKTFFNPYITAMVLFVLFIGCQESKAPVEVANESKTTPDSKAQTVVLVGDDQILVKVNGSPITRYELELAINSSLGEETAGRLKAAGRRKVLESLVASRAIAQAREAELTPEDLAALEKMVEAYREQLLVKQYLAQHASPQPVSSEMVREYYEQHPERFGAETIRTYEMIASRRPLNPDERDGLIRLFKQAAGIKDWRQWVKTLQTQGYAVVFRRGQVSEKALDSRLKQLMQPLQKGETSNPAFVKGTAYLVRIVEDKQIAPRPLKDVSVQIRKALVPVQLKKAVREVSTQVLQTADVIYANGHKAKN